MMASSAVRRRARKPVTFIKVGRAAMSVHGVTSGARRRIQESARLSNEPLSVMTPDMLIAEHRRLLSLGQKDDAALIDKEIENFYPKNEQDWSIVHAHFLNVQNKTWADIMSVRLLESEPGSIPVRLAQAEYAVNFALRRNETLKDLDTLSDLDPQKSDHLVRLAILFGQCGLFERAFPYWDKVRRLEPKSLAITASYIHFLMNGRLYAKAKQEIASIATAEGHDIRTLIVASDLALRVGDDAFTGKMLQRAMRVIQSDDHAGRGRLIFVAAKSGQHRILAKLIETVDFAKIANVKFLVDIYKVIEGRGFYGQEQRLIQVGLSLDPENQVLSQGQRRQNLPMMAVLREGVTSDPRNRREIGVRNAMDFLRSMMFWR
jgi:tetratricopeptide (TPR) repeat protein